MPEMDDDRLIDLIDDRIEARTPSWFHQSIPLIMASCAIFIAAYILMIVPMKELDIRNQTEITALQDRVEKHDLIIAQLDPRGPRAVTILQEEIKKVQSEIVDVKKELQHIRDLLQTPNQK